MRKVIAAVVAAAASGIASSSALAHPPQHWHCLETASGNVHLIARGVTEHAAHRALEQFHFVVHRGVFGVVDPANPQFNVTGKHPLGPVLFALTPTCPESVR